MTYYTSPIKGKTLHDIVHEWLMRGRTRRYSYSSTISLGIYVKFLNDERQLMPPLVLLIKFVLLLIMFQVSFSFNLLVANWRLPPEFWSANIFSTRHGDQNGRSLERCVFLVISFGISFY